jgi:hypothetical protein
MTYKEWPTSLMEAILSFIIYNIIYETENSIMNLNNKQW